ncbi:hypothetical protein [Dysgonomonas sp. Marseille-P4361]|uniref:hypothetical protein n=1 Tax=Dysgonomonas sp. Marseille-P4361 TaxID=2161820 RepID=UPI000D554511|nr:hypothetical protein [Dysgonomonas sp. Marseille-P4361]
MKRKLYNSLALALVSVLALTGFTGCTKEYITEEYITNKTGADMATYIFEVAKDKWEWNADMNRYEYAFSFPDFDQYMFDEGAVQGWVYIWKSFGEKDHKVLAQCPYVQSYPDGDTYTYSETIGYDLYLTPEKQIVFYIQASDLSDVSEYLDDYDFKINFIYRTE